MLKKIIKKVINKGNVEKQNENISGLNNKITGIDVSSTLDIDIIRASLFFNESWYRETYEFGEYLDAAEHYLFYGWKEHKNPSEIFSTDEYLSLYSEVKTLGINPLLHFEKEGFKKGYYKDELKKYHNKIMMDNPECIGSMQDGLLRIRITNACNAKCRYCGGRLTYGAEKDHEMNPEYYYKYCAPLYENLKMVLITGGDAYIAKESYSYMNYLSKNYPNITIMTESNGIAFTEKFQQLAMNNLFTTHFSINASNEDVYAKSCWEGKGGENIYKIFMDNIQHYITLLENNDLLDFAPDYSMVINSDNYFDVENFVKLCLSLHATKISFYFDYTENDMNSDYFGQPELIRPVLRKLMELERVLAGKVMILFRLWIPLAEVKLMQKLVEAVPLSELQAKYSAILKMAENRSVEREFTHRNELRMLYGKKVLTLAEDFHATVRYIDKEESICFAPWHELDLYPDGRIDVCGWVMPMLNLQDFIQNDKVDWDHLLNSYEYMAMRKRILHGNYSSCMACCPMNAETCPAESMSKYGYGRILR